MEEDSGLTDHGVMGTEFQEFSFSKQLASSMTTPSIIWSPYGEHKWTQIL